MWRGLSLSVGCLRQCSLSTYLSVFGVSPWRWLLWSAGYRLWLCPNQIKVSWADITNYKRWDKPGTMLLQRQTTALQSSWGLLLDQLCSNAGVIYHMCWNEQFGRGLRCPRAFLLQPKINWQSSSFFMWLVISFQLWWPDFSLFITTNKPECSQSRKWLKAAIKGPSQARLNLRQQPESAGL